MSEIATASETPTKPSTAPTSTAVKEEGASSGDEEKEVSTNKKSRRELPAGAVATLKAWLLSPEHFTHPYPTPQDQVLLMAKTGIDKKQLKNWFTNARRRIWKPMLKKQLEQGKIAHHATSAGGMVPLPAAPSSNPPNVDSAYAALSHHYQNRAGTPQPAPPSTAPSYESHAFPGASSFSQQPNQTTNTTTAGGAPIIAPLHHPNRQNTGVSCATTNVNSSNISYSHYSNPGVLPPPGTVHSIPQNNMNKTDSHAVLMELFARDQDLVRQATEGARHRATVMQQHPMSNSNNNTNLNGSNAQQHMGPAMANKQANNNYIIGTQHPMKTVSTHKLTNVPSINSWPHFSSVSSLNNLGTLSGVRSITNLSGADLVSQGSLNKKGNLAQVKSIECMGRADSYAFLEVFFDNPSSQRGVKREREEDNDVGLCLDDETPNTSSSTPLKPNEITSATATTTNSNSNDTSMMDNKNDKEGLKRAYDDALAARGLISVSRSSEKLTDLALPAKMQRTLSQEYLKSMGSISFSSFSFQSNQNNNTENAPIPAPASSSTVAVNQNSTQHGMMYSQQQSQQYPGQPPQQQYASSTNTSSNLQTSSNTTCRSIPSIKANQSCINTSLSDPSSTSPSVEVPSTTKCALCQCINVDTQLRPCGHMFHGRCLKPSLQNALGPPRCPIDNCPMQSAVLAVPTDENSNGTSNNAATNAPLPVSSSSTKGSSNNATPNCVKSE